MNTTLPNALEVSGISYAIRTDYRCALDALAALNDVELDEREKALFVLCVLYEDPFAAAASDIREALERGVWYLNGGEESGGESPEGAAADGLGAGFPADRAAGEPACWDGTSARRSRCIGGRSCRRTARSGTACSRRWCGYATSWRGIRSSIRTSGSGTTATGRLVDLRQALSEREQQAVAQWTGGK